LTHNSLARAPSRTGKESSSRSSGERSRFGPPCNQASRAGSPSPCGSRGVRRVAVSSGSRWPLQAKLTRSHPGDPFEREADRTANLVMSAAPERGCTPSRPCPLCRGAASRARAVQTRLDPLPAAGLDTSQLPPLIGAVVRSPGRSLEPAARAFFESRFGHDFGRVRVHADARASASAEAIQAHAYTTGNHIVLGPGQYSPGSRGGRHLLAHELAHVLQQRAASPSARLPATAVAGRWKIDDPATVQVKGGARNETLLADAFRDICNQARVVNRGSDRVVEVGPGKVQSNRTEGCGCLQIVQSDHDAFLANPRGPSFLRGLPHIGLAVNGWSFTSAAPTNPTVQVRHPEDPFGWGYWTGADQRQQKGFFRTVAHEVCGHMSAEVQRVASGRTSGRGHNEAIIRENKVAAEHGVSKADQRGLDKDEGGVKAGAHRGESFLRAQVYFDHDGAAVVFPNLSDVVDGVIETTRFWSTTLGEDRLRVQLEGFALSNESFGIATRRIQTVRRAIEAAYLANSIPDPFPDPDRPKATISRFARDIASVGAGRSAPSTSNPDRRVDVFLFHRAHSAR